MRAWELAGDQQALSWQLRAACSSARLALRPTPSARRDKAGARLREARGRFAAAETGADLAEADRLLAELERLALPAVCQCNRLTPAASEN